MGLVMRAEKCPDNTDIGFSQQRKSISSAFLEFSTYRFFKRPKFKIYPGDAMMGKWHNRSLYAYLILLKSDELNSSYRLDATKVS